MSLQQQPYRILLVEDYDLVRSAMRMLLEDQSREILDAGSGHAALSHCADLEAQGCKLDMLIVDLGLPDIRGSVLVDQIRAIITVDSVVYCSGCCRDDPEVMALLAADPSARYMEKPVRFEALLAHIDALRG